MLVRRGVQAVAVVGRFATKIVSRYRSAGDEAGPVRQWHEGSPETAVRVQVSGGEGLAATPGQIAAFERDALLATKLHVPGSRLGLVPRPRLADALTRDWAGAWC